MSSTLEFVGVALVFICLTALAFVAGAAESLDLPREQLAMIFLDTGLGTLIGIALMLAALRREGVKWRGAIAVVMGTMFIILALVYVPTWLFLTYLPLLRMPGVPGVP
ncbi:MAG: hypothetical protein Kow00124_25260 [Anaerolineae bacterium]